MLSVDQDQKERRALSGRRRHWRGVAMGLAVSAVWALSPHSGSAQEQQPQRPPPPVPLAEIAIFTFGIQDLKGRPIDLAGFKRPIVLNVWAGFCVPCRKQIPLLSELSIKHKHIAFLGVALGDTVQEVAEAAKELTIPYQVGRGSYRELTTLLQRQIVIPMTVLVSSDGRVVDLWTNLELSVEVWERKLAALVVARQAPGTVAIETRGLELFRR